MMPNPAIVSSCAMVVVAVVFVASIQASKQSKHQDIVSVAFDNLDMYVRRRCDSHLPRLQPEECLQKVMSASRYPFLFSSFDLAAGIITHLNKFKKCNRAIIGEIYDVIEAEYYAEPGTYTQRSTMEHILVDTLTRASDLCKSYLEHWFQKSYAKVNKDTRKVLGDLFSPELLKTSDNDDEPTALSDVVVNTTIKDPMVSSNLKSMKSAQFQQFYRNYVADKVVKPCKHFIKTMEVLKIAERFSILKSEKIGKLFDEPSNKFKDSLRLYKICKHSTKSELILKVDK